MSPSHVHIVDDVPELDGRAEPPVLVVTLDGFLDAGQAAQTALTHVTEDDGGRVVATFEVDAFYDYRARRPPITFVEDHYEDYEPPRLVVRLVHDATGTAYLLLHGPEPDTHWEAFCRGVRQVVDHFGVRLVVTWGSVPMAVPHTRPVMVTQHANRADLITRPSIWRGDLRIPSSALSLLELRLGEWDHPATGFVAHVPHYLAQVDYPASALPLLESTTETTGLTWDLEPLRVRSATRAVEIAAQVEDSAEVRDVVTGLEQQYDAFHRPDDEERLPLAEERELPTADQLGAEFEQFLAGLDEGGAGGRDKGDMGK